MGPSGGEDTTVILWDLFTGKPVRRLPHDGVVWEVAFDGTNRYLVVASNDGWLRIGDFTTGRVFKHAKYEHHMVLCFCPSIRGSTCVFTGMDEGRNQGE